MIGSALLSENRGVNDRFGAESTELLTGPQTFHATTTGLLYKSHQDLPQLLREWNQSVPSESVLMQHYQRLGSFFGRACFFI